MTHLTGDILAALNGPAEYIPVGERVPMKRWGKDHWSTLAYLETRIVDHKGQISHDHMRCHASRHPAMFQAKRRLLGTGDGSAYPTRLKDGTLTDHDDYDCIDDIIAAGLVTVTMPEPYPPNVLITGLVEAEMMTRATYALTEAGQRIAAALRQHKAMGLGWGTFQVVYDDCEWCHGTGRIVLMGDQSESRCEECNGTGEHLRQGATTTP